MASQQCGVMFKVASTCIYMIGLVGLCSCCATIISPNPRGVLCVSNKAAKVRNATVGIMMNINRVVLSGSQGFASVFLSA